MAREVPVPRPPAHGPRNGRMFSGAQRPYRPLAHGSSKCRSPARANARAGSLRVTADACAVQRNLERLNKKVGTMNVSSPIRKLRAHTVQGFVQGTERVQEPHRVKPFVQARKPAHINAIENSKKPGLRPSAAPQPRSHASVSAISVQEATELLARAQRSCRHLASELGGLATHTDFVVLDRVAACRGEEALEALLNNVEQLHSLSASFADLIVPGGGGSLLLRECEGGVLRACVRIKRILVSLRAMADRLVQHRLDVDAAAHVVRLVEQGLVEQLLSWVGECENAYDVLLPERRLGYRPSHIMNSTVDRMAHQRDVAPQRAGAAAQVPPRARKQFYVQPRREVGGGAAAAQVSGSTAADPKPHQRFRNPSPPVEPRSLPASREHSPEEEVYAHANAPRACRSGRTLAERRERMQRHRPPPVIIPGA